MASIKASYTLQHGDQKVSAHAEIDIADDEYRGLDDLLRFFETCLLVVKKHVQKPRE